MSYGVIYKITNKETGECYIGKSINPKLRWKTHSKRFNPENFTFEVIAKYKDQKDLDFMEKYWIWRFKAKKEGYNKRNSITSKLVYEQNKNITTVRVRASVYKKFAKYCKDHNLIITGVLTDIVEQYLKEKMLDKIKKTKI